MIELEKIKLVIRIFFKEIIVFFMKLRNYFRFYRVLFKLNSFKRKNKINETQYLYLKEELHKIINKQ
jgi:hypothetical protein